MTAHEDESAGQDASKTDDGAVSTAQADEKNDENTNGVQQASEKPEPDEGAKEKAKEMMTAYEDKPTLVMPGSGKTITGTAVNEWLDDDGNPRYADDEDSPAAKAKSEGSEATKKPDDSDESAANDSADDDEGSRAKNTAESERAAAADETAEDEHKSVEELNEEAEQRVKDNLDKDKEFNEQILEATKQDREDREKAGR
ncbi:hypothetical protein A9W98_29200 [Mycobacterium gordonae]|uniref:Uncharacterized protein n=1 Tax=Mycobacterium gordonae TaxID=1778 RepID=A0A1A6BBD1_MYCGO|nr:hypothetical protein [Mycobacterium gordonae]MBI2698322.1 hypothetical protein [Mycobacterium sp.]MCQ4361546.1 hypothetical protein [Mycobacterium gordonae]OBR99629.1 hypothetical protein A9W98_29200 [Mycobacterium gordonae]